MMFYACVARFPTPATSTQEHAGRSQEYHTMYASHSGHVAGRCFQLFNGIGCVAPRQAATVAHCTASRCSLKVRLLSTLTSASRFLQTRPSRPTDLGPGQGIGNDARMDPDVAYHSAKCAASCVVAVSELPVVVRSLLWARDCDSQTFLAPAALGW